MRTGYRHAGSACFKLSPSGSRKVRLTRSRGHSTSNSCLGGRDIVHIQRERNRGRSQTWQAFNCKKTNPWRNPRRSPVQSSDADFSPTPPTQISVQTSHVDLSSTLPRRFQSKPSDAGGCCARRKRMAFVICLYASPAAVSSCACPQVFLEYHGHKQWANQTFIRTSLFDLGISKAGNEPITQHHFLR